MPYLVNPDCREVPDPDGWNIASKSQLTEQGVKQIVEHATLRLRTQPNPTFSGVQCTLPLRIEVLSILGVNRICSLLLKNWMLQLPKLIR